MYISHSFSVHHFVFFLLSYLFISVWTFTFIPTIPDFFIHSYNYSTIILLYHVHSHHFALFLYPSLRIIISVSFQYSLLHFTSSPHLSFFSIHSVSCYNFRVISYFFRHFTQSSHLPFFYR